MPSYAIKSSGIRQVAANRLIGNSTGSTGSAEELSATDAKTLLGLGTTDSPQFAKIGIGTAASGSNDITFAPYASISVTGGIVINTDGNYRVGLNYSGRGIQAAKTLPIGWEDTTNLGSAASDTKIYRDAAGVIAQRNGANSQSFRIYHTDDGSQTNYERLSFETSSGDWVIGTSAGGTGQTGRSIKIRKDGADEFVFGNGKNITYQNLVPSADNTFRLGGSSSERWSSLYAASSYLDNIYFSSGGGRLMLGSSGYTLYAELSCNRLMPRADATYDLGAETLAWNNIKNTGSILCYNGGASNGTNYERGAIEWNSNVFTIGTEAAGTGTAREVGFVGSKFNFDPTGSSSNIDCDLKMIGKGTATGRLWLQGGTLAPNKIFSTGNVSTATARQLDISVGTSTIGISILTSGGVSMPNLPTSDPASAGELWNDSGTLKVSAG